MFRIAVCQAAYPRSQQPVQEVLQQFFASYLSEDYLEAFVHRKVCITVQLAIYQLELYAINFHQSSLRRVTVIFLFHNEVFEG